MFFFFTSSFAVLIFTCPEKAQLAVKEMDGKIFWGKKLKVRLIKDSSQKFNFASQEIKMFSATLPEQKTKFCFGKTQSFKVAPQNVNASSKPLPHNEVKESFRENSKAFSNMAQNTASFPAANQTVPSSPMYTTPAVFECRSLSPQWVWYSFQSNTVPYNCTQDPEYVNNYYPLYPVPSASTISFHTPVNIPMCKPSANINSDAHFHFKKDLGFGGPPSPTGKTFFRSNKMSSNSSTGKSNKATDAVTSQTRDTTVQPVKDPASKSSENKHASSELVDTTVTSGLSVPLLTTATTASKMPAISKSLLLNENKKTDTSGKPSLQFAAPLRSPMFVPDSVTIPEINTITIDKDFLMNRLPITDRSISFSLDDMVRFLLHF